MGPTTGRWQVGIRYRVGDHNRCNEASAKVAFQNECGKVEDAHKIRQPGLLENGTECLLHLASLREHMYFEDPKQFGRPVDIPTRSCWSLEDLPVMDRAWNVPRNKRCKFIFPRLGGGPRLLSKYHPFFHPNPTQVIE